MDQSIANAVCDAIRVPAVLERVADAVRVDLLVGPLYLDGEGNECTCFDEGARQFDYPRASHMVVDFVHKSQDDGAWHYECWSGCLVREGDLSEDDRYECPEVGAKDIAHALFGPTIAKELF